jgi:hypothetical protein
MQPIIEEMDNVRYKEDLLNLQNNSNVRHILDYEEPYDYIKNY